MIDPLEAVDNSVKPVAMHVLLARERLESGLPTILSRMRSR